MNRRLSCSPSGDKKAAGAVVGGSIGSLWQAKVLPPFISIPPSPGGIFKGIFSKKPIFV
jgi:hypothetical protein